MECYAGDVNATLALGFDSLKLDGCGGQRDIQLWSEMFNHSIRTWNVQHPNETQKLPMMLENCHDGMNIKPPPGPTSNDTWGTGQTWGTDGITPHYDENGELWCPFHTYRSGGDNRPTWGSILSHLNNTVTMANQNLSVPGCWAYPDMLEVGVTNAQLPLPVLIFNLCCRPFSTSVLFLTTNVTNCGRAREVQLRPNYGRALSSLDCHRSKVCPSLLCGFPNSTRFRSLFPLTFARILLFFFGQIALWGLGDRILSTGLGLQSI